MTPDDPQQPRPGDRCEQCGGYLIVRHSKRSACNQWQIQFLACGDDECGYRPPNNKLLVPAERIRRRNGNALVTHTDDATPATPR